MSNDDALYREPYRPQYHFSPPCGWLNDPNGLVYYEGEYHLFYQYYPHDIDQGPKHWGHAVSDDLIHWQNLPIALYPDSLGAIWSGSIVVDDRNTSGLVPGGGLVAIYTYENQTQAIAYSSDLGRTWTKYSGNPVIEARARDFRDPKVFWHDATGQWVMVLAAGKEVQVFTSPNLRDWDYRSRFTGGHREGVWEVPDLFPLELDGETKWVMLVSVSALAPAGGSGIQYFIGDFDGFTYTADNPDAVLWLDYGPDNYAGTTWNNTPDEQRVYIGWMSNWLYASLTPTSTWRGATTLPREFKLVRTADGLRLAQQPVAGITTLRHPIGTWEQQTLDGELLLPEVQGRTLEIIAEFEAGSAERFGMDVHRGGSGQTRIVYNTRHEQLLISRTDTTEAGTINGFTPAFGAPAKLDNNRLRLHIFVDESSVEVLAQDGLIALTSQTFANPADDSVALFTHNGSATLAHLEIYALDSIWTDSASGGCD
ncbi:MAG: glycoside hydrolase family 32 protein [Chloroflexi bacterium]|nr:glycoside hydrolase family 32 protein [Chloroflexota bacterium]